MEFNYKIYSLVKELAFAIIEESDAKLIDTYAILGMAMNDLLIEIREEQIHKSNLNAEFTKA